MRCWAFTGRCMGLPRSSVAGLAADFSGKFEGGWGPWKRLGWEIVPSSLGDSTADHQTSSFKTHQDRITQIHLVYNTTTMSLTNASAEDAARAAKLSSRKLATLPTSARNAALDAVHDALALARSDILAANAKDLELAQKSATDGQLNPSIVKRLDLSRPGKFEDMLQGIKDVRNLDDPGRSAPAFAFFLSFVISFIALLTRPRSRQG
jgi:hypothetical protein